MATGFVYVLINESMPGLVKIGKTKRMPTERSLELFTTGVPQPFIVKFAIYVRDMDELETDIHEELEIFRVNASREFFQLDDEYAIVKVIDILLSKYDYSVVYSDFTFDNGDLNRYAFICGCAKADIVQVVDMLTNEEWKEMHSRLVEKRTRLSSQQPKECD